MGLCMEQDAIMDSDEIDLHDAKTITDEESGRFVRSGGKECPKCGSTHCGFVRGMATDGCVEPWEESWGVVFGFMCCASCRTSWDAKYVAPQNDDQVHVCPSCASKNLGNGDGAILLRDEMLEGYSCACGSKWYDRWPLAAAKVPPPPDENLDDPGIEWVYGGA